MPKEMAFIPDDAVDESRKPSDGMVMIGYLCVNRRFVTELKRRMLRIILPGVLFAFLTILFGFSKIEAGTIWLMKLISCLIIFVILFLELRRKSIPPYFEIASLAGETITNVSSPSETDALPDSKSSDITIRTQPKLGLELAGQLKIEFLPIWKDSEKDEFHKKVSDKVGCFATVYAAPDLSQEEIGHLISEHMAPIITQTYPQE